MLSPFHFKYVIGEQVGGTDYDTFIYSCLAGTLHVHNCLKYY